MRSNILLTLYIPAENTEPESSYQEISQSLQVIPHNNLPVFVETVKVKKNKEFQNNSSRLKEIKETWHE